VFADDDVVVGSFAIYAREARQPTADELALMDSAAQLTRVAIDRHRARQALMHSEARNRAMLSAIPDWVFLTTPDGACVDCHIHNPADFPVALAANVVMNITDLLPGALGAALADAIARVSRCGNQEDITGSINYRGEEHFFEASIVQCEGDKLLTIVREVTKQTRAESEAAAQRSELAHLGRVAMLGEITWTLAHELSQPLAIMRTNADVARRIVNSADLRLELLQETIDDIITSNQRAGMVIDQLRTLLRKETPKFQCIDLGTMVSQVVDLMRAEFINRKVSVQIAAADTRATIRGDRVQVQQLILNLLLNACDAMIDIPEGDRHLLIAIQVYGDSVELDVRDTGHGIPDSELERIFKPFVSHSNKEHGLGLGLAITRSIVSAHNGTIAAQNNQTGGATLRCRFPLVATTTMEQASSSQHAHADTPDSHE
jgi:C4-dicarboxylate-specific signal transduction histidine kinase